MYSFNYMFLLNNTGFFSLNQSVSDRKNLIENEMSLVSKYAIVHTNYVSRTKTSTKIVGRFH